MFHELILALSGHPSELFLFNGIGYQIASDKELKVPLLHPSEWTLLREVLEIGAHFKLLDAFVKSQKLLDLNCATEEEQDPRFEYTVSRSYTSSISFGLEAIINKYVDVLIELEWKVLNDPAISLTYVRFVCEPFRGLFRALFSFMTEIKHQRSSCRLVDNVKDLCDRYSHYWDTLIPIVIRAHMPFHQQITNWVILGSLLKPNPEFFIQLSKEEPENMVATNSSTALLRSRNKTPLRKRTLRHFVNYTLVPSHFSPELIDRILHLGNCVIILQKSEKTRLGLLAKQKMFLPKMRDLPTDTFRTDTLSDTLEDFAAAIGTDLHGLVVIDAHLLSHLSIIKDFYLGGRGEFLYTFLTTLSENLAKKTSMVDVRMLSKRSVRLDVKECFHLAAMRVQVPEDVLQKIDIVVITDPSKTDTIEKYLSELRLDLKHDWPLHILFSPESMSGYNEMFQFLLNVRLVQYHLNTIWAETKSIFRVPIPHGPLVLRINMTYFVNNFQYYLQADVLENQYDILVETIEKSDTYDQLRIALAKFQTNIMVQSFRTNPLLRDGIEQMLDLCRKFCQHLNYLLQKFNEDGIPVCEGPSPVIDELTTDFNRRMEFLYASFRRLSGDPQFKIYLGQLLLRLDYNSHFSNFCIIPNLTDDEPGP